MTITLFNKKGILFRNLVDDVYFEWSEIENISVETHMSLRYYSKVIGIKRKNEKWIYTRNIYNYDITPSKLKEIIKDISGINLEINPIPQ